MHNELHLFSLLETYLLDVRLYRKHFVHTHLLNLIKYILNCNEMPVRFGIIWKCPRPRGNFVHPSIRFLSVRLAKE